MDKLLRALNAEGDAELATPAAPVVLVIDDQQANVRMVGARLVAAGTASAGMIATMERTLTGTAWSLSVTSVTSAMCGNTRVTWPTTRSIAELAELAE